jgi:acetyl esterase/lipase
MWRFYLPLVYSLAKATSSQILIPDYRLAPEYPFPSALDDCFEALDVALGFAQNSRSLIVIGDSAGGNLALNLAQSQKEIGGLSLLSPWLDLTHSSDSFLTCRTDSVVYPESARRAAWLYVMGDDGDWTYGKNDPRKVEVFMTRIQDPKVSPLRGDVSFSESVPILIQVGKDERLVGDSIELFSKIGGKKVQLDTLQEPEGVSWNFFHKDHQLSIWKNVPHVWQISRPWTAPAKQAIRDLISFCNTAYTLK